PALRRGTADVELPALAVRLRRARVRRRALAGRRPPRAVAGRGGGRGARPALRWRDRRGAPVERAFHAGLACCGTGRRRATGGGVMTCVVLGQVHITVTDVERSVAFYRDVVGLPFLFDVPAQKMAFL